VARGLPGIVGSEDAWCIDNSSPGRLVLARFVVLRDVHELSQIRGRHLLQVVSQLGELSCEIPVTDKDRILDCRNCWLYIRDGRPSSWYLEGRPFWGLEGRLRILRKNDVKYPHQLPPYSVIV
jgi:hypothetical protein